MHDLKVVTLKPKEEVKPKPIDSLIEVVEDLLQKAKSGELRSFVGTGFDIDGDRVSYMGGEIWSDVWGMKGSIYELLSEYDLSLSDE